MSERQSVARYRSIRRGTGTVIGELCGEVPAETADESRGFHDLVGESDYSECAASRNNDSSSAIVTLRPLVIALESDQC